MLTSLTAEGGLEVELDWRVADESDDRDCEKSAQDPFVLRDHLASHLHFDIDDGGWYEEKWNRCGSRQDEGKSGLEYEYISLSLFIQTTGQKQSACNRLVLLASSFLLLTPCLL
jgi:hypothetical protein